MITNAIINIDCLQGLKELPDCSVNCCVTSPPYYGLRDYGVDGQIGLEETPELYVQKMTEVFREVRRVLKDDGTMWLNLGDSYAGSGKGMNSDGTHSKGGKQDTNKGTTIGNLRGAIVTNELKPKDLIGIPWLVAFALRADGWYLRQDIIWHKPNPMPESVTDRCTKAHEYIFLLSKSARYYYDAEAIRQPVADATIQRMSQQVEYQVGSDRVPGKTNGNMKAVLKGRGSGNKERKPGTARGCPEGTGSNVCGSVPWKWEETRNKRSVWTVTTKPFSEAHFATFPEDLIVPCIKAGCPEGGVVLDPFMGAGTTAVVAIKLMRRFIGFELNPDYCEMAERRILPYKMQQKLF